MQTVNIHAAKTHLSRLVDEVASGQEIVIARAGKPVARLVPIEGAQKSGRRKLNIMAGQMQIGGNFDAPHPDGLLDDFERG
jgi:prevent-host-death family protein